MLALKVVDIYPSLKELSLVNFPGKKEQYVHYEVYYLGNTQLSVTFNLLKLTKSKIITRIQ